MRIMAILGAFTFSVNKTEMYGLEKSSKYHYAKIKKISSGTEFHDVGGSDESMVITARASVLESGTSPFELLESMAELKQDYPMFLGNGKYLGQFIIEEIKIKESMIYDNGVGLKQDATITITRVDSGLIDWIKSFFGGLV